MTTVIAYSGGTYGTYLEWCLTTLSSDLAIVPPFNSNGNSHRFKGNYVQGMEGWRQHNKQLPDAPFVRLHPKTKQHEDLTQNLEEIAASVDNVIYIYPSSSTTLLTINNSFTKIWADWWDYYFNHVIDQSKIYNNWPVDPGVPISQVPVWIRREFLSFYLMPAWYDQVEWGHLERLHCPNCHVVYVDKLLYQFEDTLHELGNLCDINYVNSVSSLLPFHEQNLAKQVFLNHDQLCNDIIDSILDGNDIAWGPLSLASESWIQWKLRSLGWEIQCHELDIFPTSTKDLAKILYRC